jgi:hypothetical protein
VIAKSFRQEYPMKNHLIVELWIALTVTWPCSLISSVPGSL